MVKCVSSAFLLHSTLFFLHCGKIVYVYVYLGKEVDIFSVMGGCALCTCQRSRSDCCEEANDIKRRRGGVCMCLKIYLCEEFACIVFLTRLTAQFVQSKGTVPRDI